MTKLLRYLGSGWPTTGFWRTGFSPSPPTTGSLSISHHPHPAAEPVAPFANVSDFPFSILPTPESGLCRLGGCSSYHHYHHPRNSGTVPNLKSFCVFIFKCCKCWAALAQIILTKKCCYHANAGTLRNVRKASSLSCIFLRCTHTWYLSQTPQTASFFVLSSLRYIFLCWNRRGQNTLLLKRPWILLYILEALTDFGRLESKPVHILVSCFYFWLQGGSDPRPRTIPVPGTTNTDNDGDDNDNNHAVALRQQRQLGWERWPAGCGFTSPEQRSSAQERSTSTSETVSSSSVNWGQYRSRDHTIPVKLLFLFRMHWKPVLWHPEQCQRKKFKLEV